MYCVAFCFKWSYVRLVIVPHVIARISVVLAVAIAIHVLYVKSFYVLVAAVASVVNKILLLFYYLNHYCYVLISVGWVFVNSPPSGKGYWGVGLKCYVSNWGVV